MAEVTGVERFIALKFPEVGKAARVTPPPAQTEGIGLGVAFLNSKGDE